MNFLARLAIAITVLLAGTAAHASTWPTPENAPHLVRVLKTQRVLELVRDGAVVKRYRIALGRDPVGHKQREGDSRTPEGTYTLNWRKADSVAYKSIHISYPSPQDRARARAQGVKPGGSIMIHGQWNGWGWLDWLTMNFDWTNGCIALTNADMDDLWTRVAWNTPIEILP